MDDLFNEDLQMLEIEYTDNTKDYERSFRSVVKIEDNIYKNCIRGLSHLIEIFIGMGYSWEHILASFNNTIEMYNQDIGKKPPVEKEEEKEFSVQAILSEMEKNIPIITEEEEIETLEKFKEKINNDEAFSNFMYDFFKKEIC